MRHLVEFSRVLVCFDSHEYSGVDNDVISSKPFVQSHLRHIIFHFGRMAMGRMSLVFDIAQEVQRQCPVLRRVRLVQIATHQFNGW